MIMMMILMMKFFIYFIQLFDHQLKTKKCISKQCTNVLVLNCNLNSNIDIVVTSIKKRIEDLYYL